MKAAVLEQANRLNVREVPTPQCPPDGLLLRVDGCALSAADIRAIRHGGEGVVLPVVPGREVVATIVEVGRNVRGYYDSQRVTFGPCLPCGRCHFCRRGQSTVCEDSLTVGADCDGGLAEYLAMPSGAARQALLNRVPDGVDTAAAVLAHSLACCINAQDMVGVGLGDSVLVIGCGPMGCLHAMLARARGATMIAMADASPERLKLAEAAGADRYVSETGDALRDRVWGCTARRGVDVVIVASSSPEALRDALGTVASRGRVSLVPEGEVAAGVAQADMARVRSLELTLAGGRGAAAHQNYAALQLIRSGQVDAERIITHRFRLDRVGQAVDVAESPSALKVLVEPGT